MKNALRAKLSDYFSEIDLVFAYRKVKSELYYDRTISITKDLVRYEQNLDENLKKLRDDLNKKRFEEIFNRNLPKIEYLPKTLKIENEDDKKAKPHIFFSSPKDSFTYIRKNKKLTAEFRKIARFSVEMHIVFVLWIMKVGEKFDRNLADHSYASRLPRFRNNKHNERRCGVFKPYFFDYQKWRNNGIVKVRAALEEEKEIVIATFDFTSYYHKIDPKFILSDKFLKSEKFGLDKRDQAFTKVLVTYLCQWDPEDEDTLPIGCYMSNILANIFLDDFDQQILEGLSPVYYGRYMDDIFLAIENHGQIRDVEDFQKYLAKNVSYFPKNHDEDEVELNSKPWFGNSKLVLNQNKQKLFILDGKTGIDLLDNIVSTIQELSSERRLLPDPYHITKSAAADVLTASAAGDDEVDSLRKADTLSIKRLSWSLLIRSNKLLADTLEPEEWAKQRTSFFEFVYQHVIRPEGILDNATQIPRLVTILTQVKDWKELKKLFERINKCFDELYKEGAIDAVKTNGQSITDYDEQNVIWTSFSYSFRKKLFESTIRSIPLTLMEESDYSVLSGISKDVFKDIFIFSEEALEREATKCFKIDFGLRSVNRLGYFSGRKKFSKITTHPYFVESSFSSEFFSFFEKVRNSKIDDEYTNIIQLSTTEFLNTLVYPVRRIPVSDIFSVYSQIELEEDLLFREFRKVVAAFRGTWIPDEEELEDTLLIQIIKNAKSEVEYKKYHIGKDVVNNDPQKVLVGLSHLKTSNAEWASTAADKSRLTIDRYRRIITIVNAAIKTTPKPKYLLLHELSVPEKMIYPIISRLRPEHISVVFGKEYTHCDKNQIFSTAELFLIEDRIAPGQYVQITQRKGLPAPGEDENLVRKYGKTWELYDEQKPIFKHNGFLFGVLVCSELQNMVFRKHYQGKVDSLFVLAWNRDLETFNALIEASALDIHAHIALVNNRKFGDSRVRTPFKTDYKRDVFRIKGGENDSLGVVKLDFDSLRRFQSKSKRWPKSNELYKPVPEDFKIDPFRSTVPDDF